MKINWFLKRQRTLVIVTKWLASAAAVAMLCPAMCLASVPDWLRAAASMPLPKYSEDANAVMLLDAQVTTVKDSGEVTTLYRRAYKILRPEGRVHATVVVYFDQDTRLASLKAWSIPASGMQYELKEKDALETILFGDNVYDDARQKLLKIPAAEPGSVIGYEYEQRRRPSILQNWWFFQHDVPVVQARFELRLPAAWEYRAVWLNHTAQGPQPEGANRWVWQLQNIPAIQDEPSMPSREALAGRLAVTYYAAPGRKGHSTWSDVGQWYAQLASDRQQPTAEIKQKVAELTSATPTTLDKIRALAAFVQQDIRYVAIEVGIGGYQPHPAREIFSNRYGDCKDKATLLTTMLREIGVDSYYVLINASRGVVAPEFPSVLGFNHVILAIRMPVDTAGTNLYATNLYATQDHLRFGRLLFFDPTDPFVPLGYLPDTLQSNYGLLVTESGGDLLKLPLLPPAVNRLLRFAKLALTPEGALSGQVQEIRWGEPAAELRARLLNASEFDRKKALESFIGSSVAGFSLVDYRLENVDKLDQNPILNYSFRAANYGKPAGDLLLVRPRILGVKFDDVMEKGERRYPVEYRSAALHTDIVEITVPDGYRVDELPPPVEVEAGYVSYSSKTEVEGRVLRYMRTYQIKDVFVPTTQLEELKKLYRQIAADERSSAVLKKKSAKTGPDQE